MDSVRLMRYKDREILVIDYSGCKGEKMIGQFDRAKTLVLAENRSFPILSIFDNRTFVSPEFMRHVEKNVPELESFIDKQAIVGISLVQGWILKGMNLWYKTQVHPFNTTEEALEYLVGV
jgi:hypothetical protein